MSLESEEAKNGQWLQANKFEYRYSEPCAPLESDDKQDRHFPNIEKLSYDNYLVAVNEIPNRSEF